MRNPSYSVHQRITPSRRGLEATYEESKRLLPVPVGPAQEDFWKLPMRNPSMMRRVQGPMPRACLEATYEESKQALADDVRAPYDHVWKLPMRNPSWYPPTSA